LRSDGVESPVATQLLGIRPSSQDSGARPGSSASFSPWVFVWVTCPISTAPVNGPVTMGMQL
jgi:hypothetical protein